MRLRNVERHALALRVIHNWFTLASNQLHCITARRLTCVRVVSCHTHISPANKHGNSMATCHASRDNDDSDNNNNNDCRKWARCTGLARRLSSIGRESILT